MNKIKLIAATTFGLEATVKRELINMGYEKLSVHDGAIELEAELKDIPRLNINLRSSDRVLLVMGRFKALSFDELFEGTKALVYRQPVCALQRFLHRDCTEPHGRGFYCRVFRRMLRVQF